MRENKFPPFGYDDGALIELVEKSALGTPCLSIFRPFILHYEPSHLGQDELPVTC